MVSPTEPTVYRLYGTDNELLYIGATLRLASRLASHRRKEWGSAIQAVTTEVFPSRDQAFSAERMAIWNEQPKYNLVRVAPGIAWDAPHPGDEDITGDRHRPAFVWQLLIYQMRSSHWFARRVGISKAVLRGMRLGVRPMSALFRRRCERIFDIPEKWLFHWEPWQADVWRELRATWATLGRSEE